MAPRTDDRSSLYIYHSKNTSQNSIFPSLFPCDVAQRWKCLDGVAAKSKKYTGKLAPHKYGVHLIAIYTDCRGDQVNPTIRRGRPPSLLSIPSADVKNHRLGVELEVDLIHLQWSIDEMDPINVPCHVRLRVHLPSLIVRRVGTAGLFRRCSALAENRSFRSTNVSNQSNTPT